jgi:hypothetical protein
VSLWSSIKKAAKAVVRLVVRVVVTVAMAVINVFDLLFGFFLKPRKNLTLHVVILSKYDPIDMSYVPLCQPTDVQPSIDQTERIPNSRRRGSAEGPEAELGDLLGQEFMISTLSTPPDGSRGRTRKTYASLSRCSSLKRCSASADARTGRSPTTS